MIVVKNIDDTLDLQTNDQLASSLRRFWETESLGINSKYPDEDNAHFLSLYKVIIRLGWHGRDAADVHDHFNLSLKLYTHDYSGSHSC